MPLLDGETLRKLIDAVGPAVDAVAFEAAPGHRGPPCCLLIHPRVLPAAELILQGPDPSLASFLNGIRCERIRPGPRERVRLINVNTPEEFNDLLRGAAP
jgi:molybdopterin-guanine dinucleotide biosynthesis protein A